MLRCRVAASILAKLRTLCTVPICDQLFLRTDSAVIVQQFASVPELRLTMVSHVYYSICDLLVCGLSHRHSD